MSAPVDYIRADGNMSDIPLTWERPMPTFSRFLIGDLKQALPMLGVAMGAACIGFLACLYVSLPLIQMTLTPTIVHPAPVDKPVSNRDTFTIPLGMSTPDGCAYYRSLTTPGMAIKRCAWEFSR